MIAPAAVVALAERLGLRCTCRVGMLGNRLMVGIDVHCPQGHGDDLALVTAAVDTPADELARDFLWPESRR